MISFLVAMDKNHLIGRENQLPWHLPADLQFFKKTTMGHHMVMGRKTFESIGKPLPGRQTVILTRNIEFTYEGCHVFHSIETLKSWMDEVKEEVFVIGGAELFTSLFPIADRLYITMIDHEFQGDTFFPEFNEKEWTLISQEKGIKDVKNPYDYYFNVYERIKC